MSNSKVNKFFKSVKITASKHCPEILTAIGITGMVTTTVLAVKATPKALMLMEDKKDELEVNKLPAMEVVKVTWKCYIPAVTTGITSAACLIGANSVNAKRNAALATAYKISETAFTEYRAKVVETIGEKREKDIRDKVSQDRVDRNPPNSEVIIVSNGDTLMQDSISGRYFKSDIQTVRALINDLNTDIIDSDYVSLSNLYDGLRLPHTKTSDYVGWSIHKTGKIQVDFNAAITDDGQPCIVIDYDTAPVYKFDTYS